jgi:hypothetical protein
LRAANGQERAWRFDFAALMRDDRFMDRRSLERLGHHVVSRRVALGYRNRTDLASSLQFTVRTLADIEHGVRKASPGTYAILENKLGWAPGSIDTILAGGEPKELVNTLPRSNPTAASQGYALRPTNANALSQVSTEELLLELRRRIIAPRDRRLESWDDWDGLDPNFSEPASTKNDENFLIVKDDPPLAEAYAVHIMAAYDHYRYRAAQIENKDLARTDDWMAPKLAESTEELRVWGVRP